MKSKLFVLIAFVVIVLISCTISSFAYYSFLSQESNTYLEKLKEKISYQYYYDMVEDVVKVEFVTHLLDEDQISCAEIVGAKIGDPFMGSSGRIYVLQEQKILSEEQLQYLAKKDIRVVGEWVPVEANIGYVPPSPPTDEVPTLGRWIVTKLDPLSILDELDECDSVTTYGHGTRTKEIFYPECGGGGPGGSVEITEISCD